MTSGTPMPEKGTMPRRRKLLVVGVAAGLVLAAGGATAAFAVSSHQAETKRLCVAAVKADAAAWKSDAVPNLASADSALEGAQDAAVKQVVPGASAYSKREAADGLIRDVRDRSAEIAGQAKSPKCETRDDVAVVKKHTKALKADSAALAVAASKLSDDVAAFTADEKTRIAAAKAAAKKAAAAKAAAAQRAAEEAAAQQPAPDAGGGYVAPQPEPSYGGNGGGGYNPAPAPAPVPAPAPAPPGGGGGGGWTPPPPPPGGGGCPAGMNCNV